LELKTLGRLLAQRKKEREREKRTKKETQDKRKDTTFFGPRYLGSFRLFEKL
jgi:hypothetical protein